MSPAALRAVSVTYWGFDRHAHVGTLVVNAAVVPAVVNIMQRVFLARFPLRRMLPASAYNGDDNKSMAADNTSGFSCRNAVALGARHWSMHAYGEAIDINPVENPYRLDGRTYPPSGRTYVTRMPVRPGMAVRGSTIVRAFREAGWGWGGDWVTSPDYQHISAKGR